ncbi:DUF2281 domain-containing protein [Nostoc sp. 106C]|uniref:DUF2281 domain-containing protein n=1 Tax=Nostoc sp. 106C TaxID=1932667 RepID=UPI000A37D25C|nr:DUF2281 domain-containing protein [Nostoc sp. 106C]OUL31780.1 hypothetical protein BV375_11275 [Nostoc sp. 106C]
MNIEQAVLQKLRQLPIDKQQELLDFAEFLYQKTTTKSALLSVRGLCTDLRGCFKSQNQSKIMPVV